MRNLVGLSFRNANRLTLVGRQINLESRPAPLCSAHGVDS